MIRSLLLSRAGLVSGPLATDGFGQLIVDASGSMLNELDVGRYRITLAQETLESFFEVLPSDHLHVVLRVHGCELRAGLPEMTWKGPGSDNEKERRLVPSLFLRQRVPCNRIRGGAPITRSRGRNSRPGSR